jgi:hypothetical protein
MGWNSPRNKVKGKPVRMRPKKERRVWLSEWFNNKE